MATAPKNISLLPSLTANLGGIVVCLLIGLLPITMLTELRGGSANFWGLVLMCLIICSLQPGGIGSAIDSLRSYKVLFFALLLMPLTVFMSMLWSHEFLGGDFERAARVFIGTLAILAVCLHLNPTWLRQSLWGFMAGVLGGTGTLIWESWPNFTRPDMDQYTTVGYSNLLLLLTILVLFSLGWQISRFKRTEQFLKILVVLCGLIGIIIAETRSSWLAMPFFILIGLILARFHISGKKIALLVLITAIVSTAVFFAKPSLLARSKLGVKEYVECRSTNPIADTNVCIRIQLWRASWHMFKANPLLANAGSAKFEEKLEQLHKQGLISSLTSKEFGEPHNDLFFALANYGLMGLITFLLFYFVPAFMFFARLRARIPKETRVAAAMGLAVCSGFIAFGITEAMFRSMRMLSFYAVLVAWLLALSHTTFKKPI